MRLGLKATILQRDFSQREVSKLSGIRENRLSTIVNGWVNPTPAERARLASVLRQDEAVLFDANTSIEIRSARR
jgi:transcriptional regulator with XRE-family HTH domain